MSLKLLLPSNVAEIIAIVLQCRWNYCYRANFAEIIATVANVAEIIAFVQCR
jgi:hypothetical protein